MGFKQINSKSELFNEENENNNNNNIEYNGSPLTQKPYRQ